MSDHAESVNFVSNNSIGSGGGDECAHFRELSKIEEMSRLLADMQQRLNKASMRCHLLNIDIVTQFDPHQVEMLKKFNEDCTRCIERMQEGEKEMMRTINQEHT